MVMLAGSCTVFIVGDDTPARNGLARSLAGRAGLRLLGHAPAAQAAADADAAAARILLLDATAPPAAATAPAAVRRLRRACPGPAVVVLLDPAQVGVAPWAMRAGAAGVVLAGPGPGELARALAAVAAGDLYVSPAAMPAVLAVAIHPPAVPAPSGASPGAALTGREHEVIRLVRDGRSSREIAAHLLISPKTVAQHKANIVRKLGLRSSRDLPGLEPDSGQPKR